MDLEHPDPVKDTHYMFVKHVFNANKIELKADDDTSNEEVKGKTNVSCLQTFHIAFRNYVSP